MLPSAHGPPTGLARARHGRPSFADLATLAATLTASVVRRLRARSKAENFGGLNVEGWGLNGDINDLQLFLNVEIRDHGI